MTTRISAASMALAVVVFAGLGTASTAVVAKGSTPSITTVQPSVIVGCHGLPKKIKQTHFHLTHKRSPWHIVCATGVSSVRA